MLSFNEVLCLFAMAMGLAMYLNPTPSPEVPEPRPDPSAAALATEAKKAKALAVRIQELEEQLRREAERASRREDAWMRAQARQQADYQAKLAAARPKANERGAGQYFATALEWQRKYEDPSKEYQLTKECQLAQENPADEKKGRPRWAPAKSDRVGKHGQVRPGKRPTASAQAAVVNVWWRNQFAGLEAQARQAIEAKDARINQIMAEAWQAINARDARIEQLTAESHQAIQAKNAEISRSNGQVSQVSQATTAIDHENQTLRRQLDSTQAQLNMLAQQHGKVESGKMVPAEKVAEEICRLKQTHSEELLAARREWEGKVQTQKAQLAEQREELDDKSGQLNKLRSLTVKIGMDGEAKKREVAVLEAQIAQLGEQLLNKQAIQGQVEDLIQEVMANSMPLDDLQDYVEEEPQSTADDGAEGNEPDEAEETEEQKAIRAATESITAGMSGVGVKDSGSTT